MSRRKSKQADRREKPGATALGAMGGLSALAKPLAGQSPLPSAKPTARQKVFLAIAASLLAAWLVFLVVLAVLSNSKVKTNVPPAAASETSAPENCLSWQAIGRLQAGAFRQPLGAIFDPMFP
jgi:hypothetical protein